MWSMEALLAYEDMEAAEKTRSPEREAVAVTAESQTCRQKYSLKKAAYLILKRKWLPQCRQY